MKQIFLLALLATASLISCKKELTNADGNSTHTFLSTQDIDAVIRMRIEQNGYFNWNEENIDLTWNALEHTDYVLSVGYKPADYSGDLSSQIADINIRDKDWLDTKNEVLQIILEEELKLNPSLTIGELVIWQEDVLPVLNVVVHSPKTIERLRNNSLIRYVEPMGYEPRDIKEKVMSSSGCGDNTPTYGLASGIDFNIISPNAKQSWNYFYHRIPQAWTKTTGGGVKVFIIDTGAENDQDNLGSAFNQGVSGGRTIEKMVTLPRSTFLGIPTGPVETTDDGCGHGTAMAGTCAAPRGNDGSSVGVAYNASLITCRASSDVFIDESREVKGVSDAYTRAANKPEVKIISMSMGRMTNSSQIADAIRYAYGKGKMIFCAAGTSFSWTSNWFGVIFPASMAEVNAVTGVRDNNFNLPCNVCHSGSKTDFTIVMERAYDGRHPLTLAMTGNIPSTIGGSSVATATAAGIAALVWSRFPTYSRIQILNKLITTSSNFPYRNIALGWGNLNADAATN